MDSPASLQNYVYQSLPPQSIQILSFSTDFHLFSPGSISCSLRIANTAECPYYHCLSYTWRSPFRRTGDQANHDRPGYIICDGRRIEVTSNLFDALSTLRDCIPTELQQIWIDAICIDQKNIPERDSQVAQMTTIFSSAASVIAWLGPDDRYTSQIHETVRVLRSCHLPRFAIENETSIDAPPLDPEACAVSIFGRAWFHRVWIVQEATVAKLLRLFVGSAELSWEDLGKLFTATYATTLAIFRGSKPVRWRDLTEPPDGMDLAETLHNIRQATGGGCL